MTTNATNICQLLSSSISCKSCFLESTNTTWCSTGECFSSNATVVDDMSNSYSSCSFMCSLSSVSNSEHCPSSMGGGALSLFISFLLFVFCPMCIISSGLYIIIKRCRSRPKIYDSTLPVPVLAVEGDHSRATFPVAETEIPIIAPAQLANEAPFTFPAVATASPVLSGYSY